MPVTKKYPGASDEIMPSRKVAFSVKSPSLPAYNAKGVALTRENGAYRFHDAWVEGSAVKVDGDLSEWGELRFEVTSCAEATTPNNFCRFDSKWTDKYLSIGVDVIDSHIVTSYLSDAIYNNDSIEIFLDCPNSKGEEYGSRAFHIYLQFDGRILVEGNHGSTAIDGLLYAVKLTKSGFSAEVNIPFAAMGIEKPAEGMSIGLEVCNNDNDNDLKSDRQQLTWNTDFQYDRPCSWGTLLLSNSKDAVIIDAGTPAMDSAPDLEQWDLSHTLPFAGFDGAKVGFGALCDSRWLYLGVKADDLGHAFIGCEGETVPVVQMILDGDHHASGCKNEFDWIIKWSPLTGDTVTWRGTPDGETVYMAPEETKIVSRTIKLENGYFLLCAIPWERLSPVVNGFVQRDNYTLLGFDIMAGTADQMRGWYKEACGEIWQDKAVNDLGQLFVNNPSVAAHVNTPPAGRKLYSYSIEQGTTLSGRIKVHDIDGDTITYSLMEQLPEEEGKVTVNAETGEWTYTPASADFVKPDYIKPDPMNHGRSADPTAVNFFILSDDGNGGVFKTRIEIRVCYTPKCLTYYVNGDTGCDGNDGLSEETPLKTINAAHDRSRPGDTIIIHESKKPYCWHEDDDYHHDGPLIINNSGLPHAWISYKAAPGEHPVLKSNGEWNTMYIQACYVLLDGLTIEGLADEVSYDYAWDLYYEGLNGMPQRPGRAMSIAQTNGISIEPITPHASGTYRAEEKEYNLSVIVPHHIIIRNCTVNMVAGSGIGIRFSDYVTIENCTSINNGWWNIYATSGLGTLGNVDIDDNTEDYKIIFRNNITAGNRHFIPWLHLKRLSDGNGIILDTTTGYDGRILCVNNLCYENGGSGIHAFRSDRVDIINNTILYNNATPALNYSDLYGNTADFINMFNNIVYSRPGAKESPFDARNIGCAYDNNIFFNYNSDSKVGTAYKGTKVGSENQYRADPMFTELKPVRHNYDTFVYPDDWSEEKKDNARKSGYVPGDNYDVRLGVYNIRPLPQSPAWNAGHKAWSDRFGNTENRVGVFGRVGAYGMLNLEKEE